MYLVDQHRIHVRFEVANQHYPAGHSWVILVGQLEMKTTETGEAATDKPIRASPELQSGEAAAAEGEDLIQEAEMTGLLFRVFSCS
ncbi:hypothetical protein MHYP_G00167590 [Metynnis hypsauchen]